MLRGFTPFFVYKDLLLGKFRCPDPKMNLPGKILVGKRPLGVLFLDELPEFGTRVLEVMSQPMEDKVVTISRAKGSLP